MVLSPFLYFALASLTFYMKNMVFFKFMISGSISVKSGHFNHLFFYALSVNSLISCFFCTFVNSAISNVITGIFALLLVKD